MNGIVLGRFRGWSSPPFTCPILLLKIIQGLFSQQERDADTFERSLNVAVIPTVSTNELLKICTGIDNNKASALDEWNP